MLVVEKALEHLQQRRQLVGLLLPLQVLRHLTNQNQGIRGGFGLGLVHITRNMELAPAWS